MENLPYVKSGSEESGGTESNGGSGNDGVGSGKDGSGALLEGLGGLSVGSSLETGDGLSSLESPESGVSGGSLRLVVGDRERSSSGESTFELLSLRGLGSLFVLDLLGSGLRGDTVVNTSGGDNSGSTFGKGDGTGEVNLTFHDERSSSEHAGNEGVGSHGSGLITTVSHNTSGTGTDTSDARSNVSFLGNISSGSDGDSGHVTIGERGDGSGGVHSEHGTGEGNGRGVAPGSGIKSGSSNLDHLLLSFLF
jgi:hypothetical protein